MASCLPAGDLRQAVLSPLGALVSSLEEWALCPWPVSSMLAGATSQAKSGKALHESRSWHSVGMAWPLASLACAVSLPLPSPPPPWLPQPLPVPLPQELGVPSIHNSQTCSLLAKLLPRHEWLGPLSFSRLTEHLLCARLALPWLWGYSNEQEQSLPSLAGDRPQTRKRTN